MDEDSSKVLDLVFPEPEVIITETKTELDLGNTLYIPIEESEDKNEIECEDTVVTSETIKQEAQEAEADQDPLTVPSPAPRPTHQRACDTKILKCSRCERRLRSRYLLKRHVKAHISTTKKFFKCSQCEYAATKRSRLKRHQLTHKKKIKKAKEKKAKPPAEKFKCSQCDYETPRKSRLTQHERKHDPNSTPPPRDLACSKCDYKTHSKRYLLRHELVHMETKKFKCTRCEYRTNRSEYLAQHEANHDGIKRFKCDKCEYATIFKRNLNLHSTKHSETKDFKCSTSTCNYATNRKQSLKLHELNHLEEKSLKCDKCNYATNGKLNFRQHALTHSTEKRFKCSACEYGTNFKSNLRNHELVHSNEMALKCDQCDFATNGKLKFRKHLVTHNPEKAKPVMDSQSAYATNAKANMQNSSRVADAEYVPQTDSFSFGSLSDQQIARLQAVTSRAHCSSAGGVEESSALQGLCNAALQSPLSTAAHSPAPRECFESAHRNPDAIYASQLLQPKNYYKETDALPHPTKVPKERSLKSPFCEVLPFMESDHSSLHSRNKVCELPSLPNMSHMTDIVAHCDRSYAHSVPIQSLYAVGAATHNSTRLNMQQQLQSNVAHHGYGRRLDMGSVGTLSVERADYDGAANLWPNHTRPLNLVSHGPGRDLVWPTRNMCNEGQN